MDNRTDTSEDFQSTPEHPANLPPLSGKQQPRDTSQLTAGPHNDPPQSPGVEDTYQPQPPTAAWSPGSAFQPLRQAVTRYPLQFALGLAGLGLTLALLARRKTR
jgi:hypothetical protein